jgi:hypothetical protein
VVRVDQRREGCLGGVVPFPSRSFAARILRRSDDLEVARLQFGVKRLPTWQIETAPSP